MSRCVAALPVLLVLAACTAQGPHGTVTALQHLPAITRTDQLPEYGPTVCTPRCHVPVVGTASVTRVVTAECWQVTLLADRRTTALCVDPALYAEARIGEQWPP